MKNIVAHDSLALQPGQLISVSADISLTMQIDCGRVWVTIEGDENDYWLLNGDTLDLIAGRRVVIEAYKMFSRIDFLLPQQTEEQPLIPCASPQSDTAAKTAVTAYASAV